MPSAAHKTELVQDLLTQAQDHYDDVSENARDFLDSMQEKVDFAVEEDVGNIMLTDKQWSWLNDLAEYEPEPQW